MTVSGFTITRAVRQPLQATDSQAQSHRSGSQDAAVAVGIVAAPAVDGGGRGLRGVARRAHARLHRALPERTSARTSSRPRGYRSRGANSMAPTCTRFSEGTTGTKVVR